MRPSNAHCLRLHEAASFSTASCAAAWAKAKATYRFTKCVHKLIQFAWKIWQVFGHAKLLATAMGLSLCTNHNKPRILPKNKNKRTHQDFPSFHGMQVRAAHSLASASFSLHRHLINWMPAAAIQKTNSRQQRQFWPPPCGPEEPTLGTASWRFALANISAVAPSFANAAFTSAPCCSSSWATASWPPAAAHIRAVTPSSHLLPPHRHRAVATPWPNGLMATSSSCPINAVPSLLAAATSAPCCSNSWCHAASWPPPAAHISAVKPSSVLPPHRHRAVATAEPRPHDHLQQHTSVLWHHRCCCRHIGTVL